MIVKGFTVITKGRTLKEIARETQSQIDKALKAANQNSGAVEVTRRIRLKINNNGR